MRARQNTKHQTPNTKTQQPCGSDLVFGVWCLELRRGSVLIGVLWCLALLSLVVIGVLHTSRIDLMVVKNHGDRIQAHYLALAGVEKAKALLYRDARDRSRTGKNHTGEVYDSPQDFRDVKLGRGEFRVLRRGRTDEGGGIVYGVSDEESRLNVNATSLDELSKLDGMTPDVAAAILDWRDEDNQVTPGGAEAEYYTTLQPPCLPRNGPIQTVRELLMVRGVSPQLLFGMDTHQNGMLGSSDQEAQQTNPDISDLGWATLLTVDSAVDNVSATGDERVNVQSADESALTRVRGITTDIARAIVAYRGQNRLQSIADLLDVTAAQATNQSNSLNNNQSGSPNSANQPRSNSSGSKVISQDLLMDIADEVTTDSGQTLTGVININTASLEVLLCLGFSREQAQAVIAYRQSNGYFPNVAGLLKVSGVTTDFFKQVAPRLTARSETFRILSEGRVTSSGVRQRIQEIVHIGLHSATTVSCREDDL
jgi:competence ComEA-like helix-hairpin-helix protein